MSTGQETFSTAEDQASGEDHQGIGASPGIAIGAAFQFVRADLDIERHAVRDPTAEWDRFRGAVETALAQLREVHAKAEQEIGSEEAALLGAQTMMLEDPELLKQVRTSIADEKLNAEAAMHDAAESYAEVLESMEDEYLAARAVDVRDVAERVIRVLLGLPASPSVALTEPSIILARDLTPSDTVSLDKSLVLGFCTAEGGRTSHTAILARALGLPAIVAAGPSILTIPEGETVVVDGKAGILHVAVSRKIVEQYQQRQERIVALMEHARRRAAEPAVTRDGHRVEVVANVGGLEDAEAAIQAGAEGVGLVRTEFLYLGRDHLPTEDEQYEGYRAILDVFGELPVVLRTLDIGGDKALPYLDLPNETNPFLGVRAIRLCLSRPELIKPQLRAALRAGAGRNLKVMFPMISSLGELKAARDLLDSCRKELEDEGKATAAEMEIGIMIEVPAAVVMAEHLARVVDFFSIGTNDLCQYTMAADRTNAGVASLVTGFQPAVLRLVRDAIAAAHSEGRWVGLCGELAGEPMGIPILLGLGLDEFSMNPLAIPLAKQLIRQLTIEQAQAVANEALGLESPKAVKALVKERVPAADVG